MNLYVSAKYWSDRNVNVPASRLHDITSLGRGELLELLEIGSSRRGGNRAGECEVRECAHWRQKRIIISTMSTLSDSKVRISREFVEPIHIPREFRLEADANRYGKVYPIEMG